MEYVSGGDMFEYVVRKGGLKESEARWFFQQLIIGVDYLHRMVSFPVLSKGVFVTRCAGVARMGSGLRCTALEFTIKLLQRELCNGRVLPVEISNWKTRC